MLGKRRVSFIGVDGGGISGTEKGVLNVAVAVEEEEEEENCDCDEDDN